MVERPTVEPRPGRPWAQGATLPRPGAFIAVLAYSGSVLRPGAGIGVAALATLRRRGTHRSAALAWPFTIARRHGGCGMEALLAGS